ncbi:Hydrocephalus-inducing protein [Balamuthia mandrillaris]
MLAEPFFSFPRLTVVEQNSLSETTFTRNGKEETLHIVVKNSPFVIGLRLDNDLVPPSSHFRDLLQPYLRASTAATAGGKGGSSSAAHHDPLADRVDLGRVTFDCALLYDSEDPFATPESEVDFVSKKPFHFKVEVVEDGRRANLEVRLKVLSSQHEDMFFRVKFIALDPLTKQQIAPSFVAFSAPIKVISKPEQLKKRKPSKKKTLNDFLIETLTRIEKQQNDQQKLLDVLSHQQSPPQFSASSSSSSSTPITLASFGAGSSLPSSSSSSSSQLSTTTTSTSGTSHDNVDDDGSLTEQQRHLLSLLSSSSSPQQQENSDEDDDSDSTNGADFESALTNLLHKYNALPDTEKSEQIQQLKHLLQFTQANVRENLFELNDLLQAEEEEASAPSAAASGFSFVDMMTMVSGNDEEGEGDEHSRGRGDGEETSQGGEHGEDCGCEMCPYKVELQRIETFYKDVFQL